MRSERNSLRAVLLLAALSATVLVVAHWLAGGIGLCVGLCLAIGVLALAYHWSDRMALRSMRAYPVSEAELPQLYGPVRELCQVMRLPMPTVYISPTPAPNAFATGRSPRYASICVTEGLLSTLNPRELRAVLAHELGHLANRDVLLTTVAAGVATMIVYVAHLAWLLPFGQSDDEDTNLLGRLLLLVLGPVAAIVVQLSISRSREYAADIRAAHITGDPLGLAAALRKIDEGTRRLPLRPQPGLRATGALMIANPFRRAGLLTRLFSTHPPVARRISRLKELA